MPARWRTGAALTAILLATFLGLLVAGGSAALAQPSLDEVAAELKSSAVYNDPSAESALTSQQLERLTTQIADTGLPYFIAILPESMKGGQYPTTADVLKALNAKMARPGIYAVVVGDEFKAGSSQGTVRPIADQAAAQMRTAGTFAGLQEFVGASAAYFNGGAAQRSGQRAAESSGSAAALLVPLALLGVIGVGAGLLVRRSNKRAKARRAEELAEVKQVIDEDVTEYGERLAAFDMSDPRLDDDARANLQTALDAYENAKREVDRMASSQDAAKVTTQLENGRYALACVTARLEGQLPPERRAPCFLDPRHGPSTEDLMYTPDGTTTSRLIPVCPLCATAIRKGERPAPREVPVAGGERMPYWQAGGQYAPYAGGYYSSFGDVLPALMIGTMLGSMMMPHSPAMGYEGGGGDFGGGDFGGGDFGGGDFGGGDFGGGDFGGGDFGGGDFGGF